MNNNKENINHEYWQKMQGFEQNPPLHIWSNIEKELDSEKGFFITNLRYVAAAIILAILLPLGYYSFFYNNSESVQNSSSNKIITEKESYSKTIKSSYDNNAELNSPDLPKDEEIGLTKLAVAVEEVSASNNQLATESSPESIDTKSKVKVPIQTNANSDSEKSSEEIEIFTLKEGFSEINISNEYTILESRSIGELYSFNYDNLLDKEPNPFKMIANDKKKREGHWENNLFISPEFSLNNLDSISISNSYTLGIEPSRFFNKHWFIRFGLNFSFTGDKGFAEIDYISNDYMGSYDDVYDITFDTIGETINPIYHTKTVEVWDSVRHISISEINNRYLFTTIPALVGYKGREAKINWYVYAGPAIGIQLYKWVDEPAAEINNIEIINLDNKLPLRSDVNYQLWLGGGLEYKIASNASIFLEPSYRYYFKSLYRDDAYKLNISGLALRLGFNYKIKH